MTRKKKKMELPPQQPLPLAAAITNDAIVSTPLALGGDMSDELMLEILSRLPAKSLMRFKCVRKSWLYLIEEDRQFIALHYSRSKSHKKLLLGFSCESHGTGFFTLDFFKNSTEYVTIPLPQSENKYKLENKHILRSRYGLLCYVWGWSFKIYNLFTREETPWTTSDFRKRKRKYQSCLFGFGFDPVTEKHKVLIMWTRHHHDLSWDQEEVPFCEVLTVGENTWRTIDNVPPMKGLYGKPTYANGSLYWLITPSLCHANRRDEEAVESIIEFDVGKEKLRVIEYPHSIVNDRLSRNTYEYDGLLEVDGHLGLIEKTSYRSKKKILKKMKIWILMEDEIENNKSSGRWIEETNELPFVTWWDSFESIPETDMIMVTKRGWEKGPPSIYVYDRKKKELNKYSSLEKLGRGNIGKEMYFTAPYYCVLTNIVESIYPVRAQGQTSTQHHLQ